MPVWHVSIGLRGKSVKAGGSLEKQAKRLAKRLLGNSGSGDLLWAVGVAAFHLRRKLSTKELIGLPPWYKGDYPATGGGGVIERFDQYD